MVATVELNQRSLNEALSEVVRRKSASTSMVVRKTATDITRDVQRLTRVLTGHARAGWSPWLLHQGVTPVESEGLRVTDVKSAIADLVRADAVTEGRARGLFEDGTKGEGTNGERDSRGRFTSGGPTVPTTNPFVTVSNGVAYIEALEDLDGALGEALSRAAVHLWRAAAKL